MQNNPRVKTKRPKPKKLGDLIFENVLMCSGRKGNRKRESNE
jgi:hypothetical protein